MCPPRTDQTKIDTTRTDGTEIEVKPPESCLTYQLQVISCSVIITGSICMLAKLVCRKSGSTELTTFASTSAVMLHLYQMLAYLHKSE